MSIYLITFFTKRSCLIIDKKEYPLLDKELIKELYNVYYISCLKEKNIIKMIGFVLNHKKQINHPKYFLILIETIQLSDGFFNEHYKYCCFINDFLLANEDFINEIPITSSIKFTMFMDLFKYYIEEKKDIR